MRQPRSLDSHPTAQNICEHHPVAKQTVKRILEGRGPVFLEMKVTGPGKSIAKNRHCQQPPPRVNHSQTKRDQHQPRPDEMEPATLDVAMFGQVVGVELYKTAELSCHG